MEHPHVSDKTRITIENLKIIHSQDIDRRKKYEVSSGLLEETRSKTCTTARGNTKAKTVHHISKPCTAITGMDRDTSETCVLLEGKIPP